MYEQEEDRKEVRASSEAHAGGCTSREVSLFNQILAGGWFDVCNITFTDFSPMQVDPGGWGGSFYWFKYENQMKIEMKTPPTVAVLQNK